MAREFNCPNYALFQICYAIKLNEILNLKLTSDSYWSEKRLDDNLFQMFPCLRLDDYIIIFHFLASGLSVTLNVDNPVVVETGKNITMQWRINKTVGSNINYIRAYAQLQSLKKTQIVYWVDGEPYLSKNGEKIYGFRLETDFANDKFTIKISNTKYNDSGNYFVEVQFGKGRKFENEVNVATVNVHGMVSSCFQ